MRQKRLKLRVHIKKKPPASKPVVLLNGSIAVIIGYAVLDGESAVPCNLQAAIAGSNASRGCVLVEQPAASADDE